MQIDTDIAEIAALRAYERGRLVAGARHAVLGTVLAAAVSLIANDRVEWAYLPLATLVLLLGEWRGQWSMKAVRRGYVLGLVTAVLPMTVLRPCCSPAAMAHGISCCTTPSACWAAGAVVGLALAMLIPHAPVGRRAEAVLAAAAGTISVALVRCSSLVAGEAIGLLGGITVASMAVGMARLARAPRSAL